MRRIAVINQKGGVGKTTTAVNLAAGLARAGRRVCLLDLDPQAHASAHLGVQPAGAAITMYDVLVHDRPLADARHTVAVNLDLVASSIDLAAAEVELAGVVGRELLLRDALDRDDGVYDDLIMDCAPSLGVLTVNALAAAGEVLVPLQPHYFALHGLGKLLETTALVARRLNAKLKVAGVIVCLYEANTKLAQEVISEVEAHLQASRGRAVPWANARLFATRIRRNVKLAEAPSHGQSVFDYAPKCPGAADYEALVQELMPEALAVAA